MSQVHPLSREQIERYYIGKKSRNIVDVTESDSFRSVQGIGQESG